MSTLTVFVTDSSGTREVELPDPREGFCRVLNGIAAQTGVSASLTDPRRQPTPADVNEGSYLLLVAHSPFDRPPRHLLDVPSCWSKLFDGDFDFSPNTIGLNRDDALLAIATFNRRQDCEQPSCWAVAFELGEIGTESFVNMANSATAKFNLECSLSILRATDEEVAWAESEIEDDELDEASV